MFTAWIRSLDPRHPQGWTAVAEAPSEPAANREAERLRHLPPWRDCARCEGGAPAMNGAAASPRE
jgi:hypothetical protein